MAAPSLRKRSWKRFLSAPDPELLKELYEPGLAASVRYDRCCAYFSSTTLQAAALGFGAMIGRLERMGDRAPRPAVRLLVNEELSAEDVRALTERGDAAPLEKALGKRFRTPAEALQRRRLAMLAWLAKAGLLEVRVGVMRHAGGILHAKFGLMTDAHGNCVVFRGSGNESASGILHNYEQIEVSTSWRDREVYEHYRAEFDALWEGRHPDVMTVPLPSALRERLIKLAPEEPPEEERELERPRAAMLWRWIAEAPYLENGAETTDATAMVDLWPHQRHVVRETASAWPEGRLLCDEVGMGKTLEAILVLRRLTSGRGVKRALLLVPAGLTRQWQAELREKGGLIVPRFEDDALVWPDGRREGCSLEAALARPMLLLSRETARSDANRRILLQAEPWDLVLMDEAHAARRKNMIESEFNSANLLLQLLRDLVAQGSAKGLLLLSATPMQTHPWEPWDLLQPLGEGGPWIVDFSDVRDYYDVLALAQEGFVPSEMAERVAHLVEADTEFPDQGHPEWRGHEALVSVLTFGLSSERAEAARWLRKGSPLARRLHRNTRDTLREYERRGLLAKAPAQRKVEDVQWDFTFPAEREVYDSVTRYIDERFGPSTDPKSGKGFVMTVYRRRAASSFHALRLSLERRRELLQNFLKSLRTDLDTEDLPEFFDQEDLPDGEDAQPALPSTRGEAEAELRSLGELLERLSDLGGTDSKLARFLDVLDDLLRQGRRVLVFSEYKDTIHYLRDLLLQRFRSSRSLATYTGDGGHWHDGQEWVQLTKDEVTRKLRQGELEVLLCTDAASEGLNLQAASGLVNYDLPWNPSRVEQRIGRIDRIGQESPDVLIVNLFLKDSVDERVYRALRDRCGMFQRFVGAMQPVLSQAREVLIGRAEESTIDAAVESAERDRLAQEIYLQAEAADLPAERTPLHRDQLAHALQSLGRLEGFQLKRIGDLEAFRLKLPGRKEALALGLDLRSLEHDPSLIPLNPADPAVREIADSLGKPLANLPLVIGVAEDGPFRASVALWLDGRQTKAVESLEQLHSLLDQWDGALPEGAQWSVAMREAQQAAQERVRRLAEAARERLLRRRERQLESARTRLSLATLRTLAYLSGTANEQELHSRMYELMRQQTPTSRRLQDAHNRLGGYPRLASHHRPLLHRELEQLSKNQQEAARTLKLIEAALNDPRWSFAEQSQQ